MSIKSPILPVAVAVLLSLLGATDPDAAGINTSRSNAKNSGLQGPSMESSGARAARDEIPSRRAYGEAPNRGYIVGNGGTARMADTPAPARAQPSGITVNEEGLERLRPPTDTWSRAAAIVESGEVDGNGTAASQRPEKDKGSGLATGRR